MNQTVIDIIGTISVIAMALIATCGAVLFVRIMYRLLLDEWDLRK